MPVDSSADLVGCACDIPFIILDLGQGVHPKGQAVCPIQTNQMLRLGHSAYRAVGCCDPKL
jgi:hypothetical protein